MSGRNAVGGRLGRALGRAFVAKGASYKKGAVHFGAWTPGAIVEASGYLSRQQSKDLCSITCV
jgi:hypothetical protein